MAIARLPGKSGFSVGVAAGSGFVASSAERGGADFLLALNAARLRNMGAPSIACLLPLANAARQVETYAFAEVLPLVNIPVLVGTNCWQRGFDPDNNAQRIMGKGFAGAANFPPSSLFPKEVQKRLEFADMGFSAELRLLSTIQNHGGVAVAYCASVPQARQAALAGLNHILLNYGWNTGGVLSPTSDVTLEEAATIAASVSQQVRRINPDTHILLEGGPIETSADLNFVLRHAKVDGYIGGSTFERLPVEQSIADRIASFHMATDVPPANTASDTALRNFAKRTGFVGQSATMLNMVEKLRLARDAQNPLIHLQLPTGETPEHCLNALTRDGHSHRKQVVEIDASCLDVSITELQGKDGNAGYCHDTNLDFVVIRNPQGLSIPVQKRLADHLITRSIATRHTGPRFVLVSFDTYVGKTQHLSESLQALCAANAIQVPGLKDRFEDIAALLSDAVANTIAPPNTFSPAALRRLRGYAWPGNTAELVSLCSNLADPNRKQAITLEEVETALVQSQVPLSAPADQRRGLMDALMRNNFRKGQTADALGISRKTLYNRMRRYGLS